MVRGKFAFLALGALAIGWLMARLPGFFWGIAGLIVTAGGAVMLFGVSSDAQAAFLGLGGAISWGTLFLAAIARIFVLQMKARSEAG
jgi:hypothetical protein